MGHRGWEFAMLKVVHSRLPSTIQGLRDFIVVTREQLRAHQAKIRAIDKLGLATGVRTKALEDAQGMGAALLYAEVRLGELLKDTIRHGGGRPKNCSSGVTVLPDGITRKQSHWAQKLAGHQIVVEKVIDAARRSEDIPT